MGTEAVYSFYAESFTDRNHLQRIQEEAYAIIQTAVATSAQTRRDLAVSGNHIEGDTMPTIEIRIRSLAQLFDALDPAPLQERALDRNVESFILASAGTHRPKEPLRLLVHLPESLRAHAADATDAIHEHFRRAHAQGERNFRRRLRIGGFALAVASVVLAGSFGLRSLLSNFEERALVQGLREGLLILGWVAMWRPVEILLFERWESHLDHAMLERLASMPIEFVFQPDRGPASMTGFAG